MRKKHEVRHENKPQRWVKVCLKGWRANRKHILLQSLRRRIPTENLQKKTASKVQRRKVEDQGLQE